MDLKSEMQQANWPDAADDQIPSATVRKIRNVLSQAKPASADTNPVDASGRDTSGSTDALPTRCQCGGKLIYSHGPGDYVAVVCDRCTPVVRVDVRKLGGGEAA